MFENTDKKLLYFKVFIGITTLIFSFVVIKEGFYMDENGLLSTYKAIYQGNKMFIDSWGALQVGGILTYPLFALYYEVLEPFLYPIGIGFILYTRILYQIVRLAIAVYLYFTIRKTDYAKGAFITALTYYLFFISFKNFSYKSMCDFGVILFICWTCRFFVTRNKWYFIPMGIATCVMILSYPTMIIFPFVVVIAMIIMMLNGYDLLKPIIIYILTCAVIGIAVLVYLQFTAGLWNILPQLQYLEDSAYKNPGYIRFGKMIINYLAFFAIAYVPIVVMNVLKRTRSIDRTTEHKVLSIYWILFMAAIILVKPSSVSASRFIYGCLIVMWWLPYFINYREKTPYTQIGKYRQPEKQGESLLSIIFLISVVVQLIWSISTNQGITVPGYMCFYVVLLVVLIADSKYDGLQLLKIAIVVLTIYFSLIWIAEGDGGYNDIFEKRYYVTEGAYKGIALDETDYNNDVACYKLVSQYVSDEDHLFVLHGYSYSAYLNTNALQGVGSPYSRAGANQNRVLQYWEVNPENQPDYIMINPANKYYFEFEDGDTAKYIFENYTTTVAEEGDFILLTR